MATNTTRDLVARLVELLSNERIALTDFLLTLASFDRQRRWAELGYASLYDFLVRELGMSRGTAFYRKVAVELIQRYPEVLEALRDGRLCITVVFALSKVITPKNCAEVLPRFFHVSKQEAKAISVEIAPALEVPRKEVVTLVRTAPASDLDQKADRLALPQRRSTRALSQSSAAMSGCAIRASANGRSRAAASAARPSSPSSTTSTASSPGSPSRRRISASAVTRTTRSTPGRSTATTS